MQVHITAVFLLVLLGQVKMRSRVSHPDIEISLKFWILVSNWFFIVYTEPGDIKLNVELVLCLLKFDDMLISFISSGMTEIF